MKHLKGQPEEFTAINEAVSTTGKYAIAFGKHFRPMICYDVIALNRLTGECIRRHYGDDQAGAMIFWDEFKQQMTALRGESEEGEPKDVYRIFGPSGKPN